MLGPKTERPSPAPREAAERADPPNFLAEARSFAPSLRSRVEDAPADWAGRRRAPQGVASARFRAEAASRLGEAGDPRKRALIVIPALDEESVIEAVIARVLDDDHLVDPLVVVADGGSTDATREIVREIARRDPRVSLIDNPGRLQSAGLNLAAAAIAGDRPWLIRVDAHADYPRNYVSTLIEEALRTGASSVVVSMDTVGEAGFQRAVAAAQNSVLGTGGSAHRTAAEARWVDHGHHALFDVVAFEAIGGYDESFSHNEDAELDIRLTRRGGRIWLTDQVRIAYHPRRTAGALWAQYFSYGRGRARTALKHHAPLKLRQALPLTVAPAVAAALLSPVFAALAVPALIWAAAALAYGAVLAARRREACVLLSGPAAMIMHFAWSAGFWTQLICHLGERKVGDLLALPRQAAS
jgi:succinoglycan biosynthesis protein ExoA